jgi:hypothetical protein
MAASYLLVRLEGPVSIRSNPSPTQIPAPVPSANYCGLRVIAPFSSFLCALCCTHENLNSLIAVSRFYLSAVESNLRPWARHLHPAPVQHLHNLPYVASQSLSSLCNKTGDLLHEPPIVKGGNLASPETNHHRHLIHHKSTGHAIA